MVPSPDRTPPASVTADPGPGADEPLLYDARLAPHRSLSPVGFTALMVAISAISFAAGTAFYLIGAWPIVGFLGLDVLLVYVAFKVSFRRARAFELLRLTAAALIFEKVSPAGQRRRWIFQPYWLRVELDADGRRGGELRLRTREQSVTVGAFLAPPERETVADGLRTALHRLRNPTFS